MILDVVVHLLNEQPVIADLFERPNPADVGLLCTNLRTLDGRRPIFIEATDSTFFLPYHGIRFIEIRTTQGGRSVDLAPTEAHAAELVVDDGDLEIDEDFLRRIREA